MWKPTKRHSLLLTVAVAAGLAGAAADNAHAAQERRDAVSFNRTENGLENRFSSGAPAEGSAHYANAYAGARGTASENDRMRIRLLQTASKYLGTPYVFGAHYGQTKSFDCSSFAKTVFAENEIELPRVSRDQAKRGVYVKRSELKAGDLVFFTTTDSGGRIGHVGIYAGNGRMIHTYGEGGVKYSRLDQGYWNDHYVTARRVLKD